MQEIRFHGRAGQGILTASRLFAQAAITDGKYAQAFPDFGPERLGSPLAAFARIDDETIEIRSQVYTPNAVAVFEESLLETIPVTRGMPAKAFFVVNAPDGKIAIEDFVHVGKCVREDTEDSYECYVNCECRYH